MRDSTFRAAPAGCNAAVYDVAYKPLNQMTSLHQLRFRRAQTFVNLLQSYCSLVRDSHFNHLSSA